MKLRLSFAYSATWRESRKRNHNSATRPGESDFEFREVGADARRLAFVVGQAPEAHWRTPFRLIDGKPARVWEVDGRFFAERCRVDEFDRQSLGQKGDNLHDDPFRRGSRFPGGYDGRSGDYKTREQVDGETKNGLAEWSDDGGAAASFALQREIDGSMVVIDGMVCWEVGEPCLAFRDSGDALSLVIEEAHQLHGRSDHPFGLQRFRIDRKEEAADFGARLAAVVGSQFKDLAVVAHVDPDAVTFQDDVEALGRSAHAITTLFARDLALLPRPVVEAWFPLRDALIQSRFGSASRRLADALGGIAAVMDAAFPKRHDAHFWLKMAQTAAYGSDAKRQIVDERKFAGMGEIVCEAAARWARRPLRSSEWVDAAPPATRLSTYEGEAVVAVTSTEITKFLAAGGAPAADINRWRADGRHVVAILRDDGDPRGRGPRSQKRRVEGFAALGLEDGRVFVGEVAGVYGKDPDPSVAHLVDQLAALNARHLDEELVFDADPVM